MVNRKTAWQQQVSTDKSKFRAEQTDTHPKHRELENIFDEITCGWHTKGAWCEELWPILKLQSHLHTHKKRKILSSAAVQKPILGKLLIWLKDVYPWNPSRNNFSTYDLKAMIDYLIMSPSALITPWS